jgi:CBS domain-containing protein
MDVAQLMTKNVSACGEHDTFQRAAQLMWENDCGCVPVVDSKGSLAGIVTDRDICMATYTQGRLLGHIEIASIALKPVFTVRESDAIDDAERLMRDKQVRRVPVVDDDGRLSGMLSLADVARHHARDGSDRSNGRGSNSFTRTVAAISEPRNARVLEMAGRRSAS